MKHATTVASALATAACLLTPAFADTWYVDQASQQNGPGTNWATAFHIIQDGVNAASAGDTVLVTNGVYGSGGDVLAGMLLTNRVCIATNITVQSVHGPEHTFIVGAADPATTNGPAAVRCAALVSNAVLCGFTLKDGYTEKADENWSLDQCGAGAFLAGGTVSNCIITSCFSWSGGGGAYVSNGVLSRCEIRGNEALDGDGGGICFKNSGLATDCLIAENVADFAGGGVYCNNGGELVGCTVVANEAEAEGGGICAESGAFRNCIIYFNTTEGRSNHSGYDSIFEYCCTVPFPSDDDDEEMDNGGTPPSGCITNDPGFLNPAVGDYRLRSSSACLDTGTNGYVFGSIDLPGKPRIVNGTVDMGAYESVQLLAITNPANGTVVYGETTVLDFGGTADASIVGQLSWTNLSNGANGTVSALASWSIAGIPIQFGDNTVMVSGTNALGDQVMDAVDVTRLLQHGGSSPEHYAWTGSPSPSWPYTNWNTSAHVLQDAIDATVDGDTVWVTNGVYDSGGDMDWYGHTNRAMVARAVVLRSASGPSSTFIVGQAGSGTPDVDDAVRCVYLAPGAELHGFTLTNGYANSYAGGIVQEEGTVVSNCVVIGCTGGYDGGGIHCTGGRVADCRIIGNSSSYNGGGVYCCSTAYVARCTIASNTANAGGGLNLSGDSMVVDCVVSNNTGEDGAGIYCFDSTVSNCTIAGNWGLDNGGGIRCGSGVLITHCTIKENSTRQAGGGVRLYNGGQVTHCSITDNESRDLSGGGVDIEYSGTVRNCLIAGNRSPSAAAGLYFRQGGLVEQCTIAGNESTGSGSYGAVYCNGGGTLRNTIIYGNTAGSADNHSGSGGTYTYCCTTPDPGGTGNITANPMYIDAGGSNYRLQLASPCIDAGTNSYAFGSTDLDGNARIVNVAVDIGAYEYDGMLYDSDGDAQTDYDEYVADTSPTNAADFFRIASISNSTVHFDSSSNRLYTLLITTNLVADQWSIVTNRMGIGGTDSMSSTNAAPAEFYKLEVQIP